MAMTTLRYTFDEWIDSPENTPLAELVEGIPVERMATTFDHGQIVGELWDWLRRAQRAGFGWVSAEPVGVVLDANGARRNVREPDLCFIRKERAQIITGKAVEGVPDLVIEVLSPTTRDDDLPQGEKWRDYARFGVPRYWIVDPEERTVAQYTHTGSGYGEPVVLRDGDALRSELFSGITLPVGTLFHPWPPLGA
jgi:Uma2 family endonuclease